MIAPGNLRATQDNEGYAQLFDYWVSNTYQLRYTGGMVPDVNQLLVKGKGVFVNVASKNTKSKLRMLYEVAPMGFLVEKVRIITLSLYTIHINIICLYICVHIQAGGKTSEGDKSVLDVPITQTEQVSQVAFGSKGEVARFEQMVGKKYV